jgi:hypothetical protein
MCEPGNNLQDLWSGQVPKSWVLEPVGSDYRLRLMESGSDHVEAYPPVGMVKVRHILIQRQNLAEHLSKAARQPVSALLDFRFQVSRPDVQWMWPIQKFPGLQCYPCSPSTYDAMPDGQSAWASPRANFPSIQQCKGQRVRRSDSQTRLGIISSADFRLWAVLPRTFSTPHCAGLYPLGNSDISFNGKVRRYKMTWAPFPLQLLLVVVYIMLSWSLITASHPSKQKANMNDTVDTKTHSAQKKLRKRQPCPTWIMPTT